jgi:hypothetical protein
MTAATRLRPSGFIEPCLPTVARKPPTGPEWVHEIKHDALASPFTCASTAPAVAAVVARLGLHGHPAA